MTRLIILCALFCAPAQATEVYSIDVPPGALADSIIAVVGTTHDLQILYPAHLTHGLTASGVRGRLTVEEALQLLLSRTCLDVKRINDRMLTLVQMPKPCWRIYDSNER
jgi:hypothetical protein